MIDNTTPDLATDAHASDCQGNKKPCIALMGEFSAGKTTLINFLIGEDVLPTKITATQVPPVWLSYGEDDDPFYVDSENRSYPVDLTDIQNLDVKNVRYIKVFARSEFLKNFDLIDTPGISDPNIPEFHRDTAIDNADAIVWCTHATQAWRESENSAWSTVPATLQATSILVATRADKLDERNRDRVKKRLQREAGEKFATILMFSAMDALKAKTEDGSPELMERSGGAQLLNELWKIAGRPGADVPSDASSDEPEPPAVAIVRPVRVTSRSGRGRPRITADEAQTVRSQILSPTPEAPLDRASEHEENSGLDTTDAELSEERDNEIEDTLLRLQPETRAETPAETAQEPVNFPNKPAAEPVEALLPETDARREDEQTLSALKEILHDSDSDTDPVHDTVAMLDTAEPRDQAITPLELWNEVQKEYDIKTIADVVGAVTILLEVMQEHRICFANCCQSDDMKTADDNPVAMSLSG